MLGKWMDKIANSNIMNNIDDYVKNGSYKKQLRKESEQIKEFTKDMGKNLGKINEMPMVRLAKEKLLDVKDGVVTKVEEIKEKVSNK